MQNNYDIYNFLRVFRIMHTIKGSSDELVGEQQVVVKPIPPYICKSKGIAGCTIQGDGSIS